MWLLDVSLMLDVAEFERAVRRADEAAARLDEAGLRRALEEAASAYGGDLLPTYYDDWLVPERTRLRESYAAVVARLVQLLEEQRAYALATQYAQKLLQHDPLREEATAASCASTR